MSERGNRVGKLADSIFDLLLAYEEERHAAGVVAKETTTDMVAAALEVGLAMGAAIDVHLEDIMTLYVTILDNKARIKAKPAPKAKLTPKPDGKLN